MITVIMRQQVKDVAKWLTHFQAGAALRLQHGCRSTRVLRGAINRKEVVVQMEWPDAVSAQGWLDDPEVKADLARTGVDEPTVIVAAEQIAGG